MLASFQAVGHVWEDKDLFQRAVTTGARVVQLSFQTQNGTPSGPVAVFFLSWIAPTSHQTPEAPGVDVFQSLLQEALVQHSSHHCTSRQNNH